MLMLAQSRDEREDVMGLRGAHVLGFLFAASMAVLLAQTARADDIQGAGSSFVAPIMTKWAEDYARSTGVKVLYQSVGSGAGIQKIKAGEVDFGASDKPLPSDELKAAGLCQFPVVIGGVVPVVNLPGVSAGTVQFTGQLLADIYMGKLTAWDAPEIKAVNPGLKLPALPITVVHRSDGSGTTFNWVNFLSRTSPVWKNAIGSGLAVAWPVGVGGEGNAGVATAVKQTQGAIGYVEYTFALQNDLVFGQVQNGHGLFVAPSPETFQAAASTVNWPYFKDFSVSIGDAAGAPNAYPITATTFVLMYKEPKNAAHASAALAFFKWALENGDDEAGALHYVALPPNLVKQVEMYWASQIRTAMPKAE